MDDMSGAVLARTGPAPAHGKPPVTSATHHVETVLWVRHWTEQYFSFAITRPASFRFRSGEFVMIGLPGVDGGKPILRAYSIASPSYAETLEFFSIAVADGPLTSRLQKIEPGDQILMAKKPVGTLVLDALQPGRRLFLLGTGTGLAPWLSVARDPDVYDASSRWWWPTACARSATSPIASCSRRSCRLTRCSATWRPTSSPTCPP